MKTIFTPARRQVHGAGTDRSGDRWPTFVVTPTEPWSYGVSFTSGWTDESDTTAIVGVDVTVVEGAVAIAWLGREEEIIGQVFRDDHDGRCVVQQELKSLAACSQIVVRNADRVGPSCAVVHGIAVNLGVSESPTPLLVIPAETFSRYGCSTGIIPAGFVVDWLGTHTRGDVEDYLLSSDVAPFISYDRYFEPTPPLAHELVLDWLPLLDAVELAGHTFTIVALGAGWGRWIVAGAFAALKRGRDYRVVGVEAEPTHFAWMERHLRDNNIDPDRARLIQAAANSYTGTCQFMVGNPTGIYGQRIIDQSQEASDELRVAFNAELQRLGVTPQEVLCVDLEEVFQGLERVDYMHMDIQGAEADVLLAKPDLLDERVAVINVGAHSELIERRLRRHFLSRGWHRMYDVPMGASVDVRLEGSSDTNRITWGDGVQVWENRRLTRRQSGPSFVVGAA